MVMGSLRNKMIATVQRDRFLLNGTVASILGGLLFWISGLLFPGIASATTIYSYVDDRGTPVLTDNLENIPERYRAKVQVTEQAPKGVSDLSAAAKIQQQIAGWAQNTGTGLDKFTPNISGLTRYQSQVFSFGGLGAVVCLLARFFLRNQAVRFLSLWCLIMLGLIVPALVFTSQDAPLDRLTGQAGKIQQKQQNHLPGAL